MLSGLDEPLPEADNEFEEPRRSRKFDEVWMQVSLG
jgi:hypothetical protein